jgi:hypothetical protein
MLTIFPCFLHHFSLHHAKVTGKPSPLDIEGFFFREGKKMKLGFEETATAGRKNSCNFFFPLKTLFLSEDDCI